MADGSAGGNVAERRAALTPALTRARRAAIALLACLLCAYGYGSEPDPFIEAWKKVAASANQGRWAEASAASQALAPGLAELDAGLGGKLAEPMRASLEKRDPQALARELTRAASGVVLWKLEASRRAGLDDYYTAKYRVEAARTAYLELLAPALSQRD